MRLYLAVAMLMLAFVAYTEAQDAEQTIVEKATQITQQIADKAKSAYETFVNSDFAATTNAWLNEKLNILKTKVEEISN